MPTRIQSLFLVRAAFTEVNTGDWLDALAFYDAAGAPIDLDGIEFRAIFRSAPGSTAAFLALASPGVVLDVPVSTPRGVFLTGGADGNVLSFYAQFGAKDRPQPLPGTYVADVMASADGVTRRVVDASLNLLQGTTP